MHETPVTVVGNLVADPVRRETTSGSTAVTLRIASTERRWSPEEGRQVDGRTSFYNVTCWGYLGENVTQSLKKGQRVVVSGRLTVREYTDAKDQPRTSVDIDARAVGHDLTFGTSVFTRFIRQSTAQPEPDSWAAGPAELDGVTVDENGNPVDPQELQPVG